MIYLFLKSTGLFFKSSCSEIIYNIGNSPVSRIQRSPILYWTAKCKCRQVITKGVQNIYCSFVHASCTSPPSLFLQEKCTLIHLPHPNTGHSSLFPFQRLDAEENWETSPFRKEERVWIFTSTKGNQDLPTSVLFLLLENENCHNWGTKFLPFKPAACFQLSSTWRIVCGLFFTQMRLSL